MIHLGVTSLSSHLQPAFFLSGDVQVRVPISPPTAPAHAVSSFPIAYSSSRPMGGGDSTSARSTAANNPQAPAEDEPSSSSSGAAEGFDKPPIQLLVLFHRAIRAELADLRRLVIAGAEETGGPELAVDLRRRFEFLKQVQKYHCTAEDEVIFAALDSRIKNITSTYCLEHQSIDDLFESIISCLNLVFEKNGSTSDKFQELVFSAGALEKAICKHMVKEEEQVFPLLMKEFTESEQGALVWQFICSVPVTLLVNLFPWMKHSLSKEEHVDLQHCIKKVVPNDRLLQELVISWLESGNLQNSGVCFRYGKLAQCPKEPECTKDILQFLKSSSTENSHWSQERCLQTYTEGGPIDGLQLWHAVLKKDLKEILEELYEMKRLSKYSSLNSVVVRIKFLGEVVFFYSNLLDKVLYPLIKDVSGNSPSCEPFLHKQETGSLQYVLYHDSDHTNLVMSTFVDKLSKKMEPFAVAMSKHFSFYETEVFPLITKKCNHETQKQILFSSIHMMPLGLLKCVTTWFSPHLPKDKLKYVLQDINQSGFFDKSFASLLHEWIRLGYSGKTSLEDLLIMFKSNASYLCKQFKEDQDCRISDNVLLKPCSSNTQNAVVYSAEINSRLFFPQNSSLCCPFLKSPSVSSSINIVEPRPMDHIYYFHKALKKELESLVLASYSVSEKFELLADFRRRFRIMQSLYLLHSEAEDQIAFPAMEAKKRVQNISQSYSIDHRLDAEYFNHISDILSEMSELYHAASISSVDSLNPDKMRYHQLSLLLQNGCRSLQKILVDHMRNEEIEIWPLFRECFSIEEQERIIGCMLGRTRAEILQELILWLLACLTPEEQHAIMAFWRKATKDTMFDEWLGEWWEGMKEDNSSKESEDSDNSSSLMKDVMAIVLRFLYEEDSHDGGNVLDENVMILQADLDNCKEDDEMKRPYEKKEIVNPEKFSGEHKKQYIVVADTTNSNHTPVQSVHVDQKLLTMSQGEMEAIIRRISRDSSLDREKQTRVIQCLLSSRWAAIQQQYATEDATLHEADKLQGQFPSYRDHEKTVFGCKHYKTNCKLVSPCCNQIFTCRRCHDDVSDHKLDRKSITQMLCMKCLVIQPIGPMCITSTCEKFSMARHYCRICKLFDDDRDIYHCPFCNICRVGKGLGIDFFHCMKCNACMSPSLSVHVCREKCFEDVCPICHEDMFTSSIPVKALGCGHLMHSTCFQDYTRLHYICPVCSKSLGDMQVYFAMLDALLAEDRLPDEYHGQTQAILCNDCEKRGTAPFHWVHHKCPFCGSYNTRLL